MTAQHWEDIRQYTSSHYQKSNLHKLNIIQTLHLDKIDDYDEHE
ncbi:MAG: hypothetical protein ACKPER_05290 [Dolichospermum sp.]